MARLIGDDVLEQIGISIEKALVGHKLDKEIAIDIAARVSNELRATLGGQTIYFSKAIITAKAERDKEIFQAFNGKNGQELAIKYGVSEMRIRQIINKMTELRRCALRSGLADPFKNISSHSLT